jgi:hypothetical protein
MKKKIEKEGKKNPKTPEEKKISRKEAIKKSGYLAFTAAGMMISLGNPQQAQAASPASPTAW